MADTIIQPFFVCLRNKLQILTSSEQTVRMMLNNPVMGVEVKGHSSDGAYSPCCLSLCLKQSEAEICSTNTFWWLFLFDASHKTVCDLTRITAGASFWLLAVGSFYVSVISSFEVSVLLQSSVCTVRTHPRKKRQKQVERQWSKSTVV